ncbi:MAG: hypothetical protein LBJ72_11925 [Dysgonamonadaceae bacterium]|jgi:hypothetical protein|nr:hypothetical protein [Dysgonamonadaceae bacterium]
MAKELTTFQKIEMCLFDSRSEASAKLTAKELEIKERWMLCVAKKMENPLIQDIELAEFLTSGGEKDKEKISLFNPVSKATAYRDLASISRLVGNIQLAAKNWYRYMIIEGAKKAYKLAEEEKDVNAMNGALDKIGKYTRSDKDDEMYDWTQMLPPVFEPSDDITLLGDEFEPVPSDELEQRRKELRNLFKGRKIEDIEYTEIKNAGTSRK